MIWRRMRIPLVCLAIYAIAALVFTVALPHDGLVSPDGTIDRVSATATILVLGLRMVILFVVLPFSAYRLVNVAMADHRHERETPST